MRVAIAKAVRASRTVGSSRSPFSEKRRRPEFVDQAHTVVRRGAVGAEPDEDFGVQHVRHTRQAEHPQVGGEVVGDGGAALGEECDLLVLQPDRVGTEEPGSERTEVR